MTKVINDEAAFSFPKKNLPPKEKSDKILLASETRGKST